MEYFLCGCGSKLGIAVAGQHCFGQAKPESFVVYDKGRLAAFEGRHSVFSYEPDGLYRK